MPGNKCKCHLHKKGVTHSPRFGVLKEYSDHRLQQARVVAIFKDAEELKPVFSRILGAFTPSANVAAPSYTHPNERPQ
jgi:hypothetical protein